MAGRPRRASLGALFTVLALGFAALALLAGRAGSWVVCVAAAALALWLASLAASALRPR